MKRIFLAMALVCAALSANAQHSLQVDDGAGRIGILSANGSMPLGITTFLFPTTGGVLLTTGSIGTTAWLLTGNAGTTAGTNFVGTTDVTALHLYVNSGTTNSFILTTTGSIQRDNAGNARGTNAVDMQFGRAVATQVASGNYSVIGGGQNNRASSTHTTIGGGLSNIASVGQATVGGGSMNTASAPQATIGGGTTNIASHEGTTVAGGSTNTASGQYGTVGGGYLNIASNVSSTVSGGIVNTSSGFSSTVSGGSNNTANNTASTVGGGYSNTGSGTYSTVAGGLSNTASGNFSAVGGGQGNIASGPGSFVGGGGYDGTTSDGNTASGNASTVAGGLNTQATGNYSFVGGGVSNVAVGPHSVIVGGSSNNVIGQASFIGTGYGNSVAGNYSFMGVGFGSSIAGDLSAIPGGSGLTLDASADESFGFLAGAAGTKPMTISATRTAVFGNTDLWLANNDNTARELRFYEAESATGAFPSGTKYVALKSAATLTNTQTYTLPLDYPASNGLALVSTTGGALSWTALSTGDVTGPASAQDNAVTRFDGTTGKLIQNSALIVEDYSTSTQNKTVLRADDGATLNISLVLSPKGTGAIIADNPDGAVSGGNARGLYSVDMQMSRTAATQVASGLYSVIGGGLNNTATFGTTTVSGGSNNTASNDAATVGGGYANTASGSSSTVSGGNTNIANNTFATVGGGNTNTASGHSSTVSGGNTNIASNVSSTVSGGYINTASGSASTVSGGQLNMASSAFSKVGGGYGNTASGSVSTVSGGNVNTASGVVSTVGGGELNTATQMAAVVAGGQANNAISGFASVLGGSANTASGVYSTVSGGRSNTVAGDFSSIAGGSGLTLDASAYGSFGYLGGNTGFNNMTISAANTAVFGNTNLWLANNNSTASELRFYEAESGTGAFPSGTKYVALKSAATLTNTQTYTLPLDYPASNGRALVSTTGGAMSWAALPAGDVAGPASAQDNAVARFDGTTGKLIQNSALIVEDYSTSTQNKTVLRADDGATANISLVLAPKGAGALIASNPNGATSGGNARGNFAVDLQLERSGATEVASGLYSVITGGRYNTASVSLSVVGGGESNNNTGTLSVIGGGYQNTMSGPYSVIGGGSANTVAADQAVIPGGRNLTLSASADNSFGFNSGNTAMTISDASTSVFANSNLWLANNDNAPRELRFYDAYNASGAFPNTAKHVAFKAPSALTATQTYTLPLNYPSVSGYVLSSTTGGTMSWVAAGGLSGGTSNAITKWTSATTVGNSNMTDNGSTVNIGSNVSVDLASGNLNVAGEYQRGGSRILDNPGTNNLRVGGLAGHNNSGVSNTYVGASAGAGVSSGSDNVYLGFNSGVQTAPASSSNNVMIGSNVGTFSNGANNNTFIGYGAAVLHTSGGSNTFLGTNAGATSTTESNNTLLGGATDMAASITRATAIGYRAYVSASDALVLGAINGVNGSTSDALIGIGTTSPTQKLEVKSGNILLSNAGTAGQLQLQGTSSGVSTFAAGAQGSTTINYTLPTTQPAVNQVLKASSVTGSGPYSVTMTWDSVTRGVFSGSTAGNSTDGDFSNPNGDSHNGTENNRTAVIPITGTLRNLYIWCSAATNASSSKTVTVRINGANTGLSATIGAASQTANNTSNRVSVSAGDRISIIVTHSATNPGNSSVGWGFEIY